MKLFCAILALGCLLADVHGAAIEGLPSFKWADTRTTEHGVPHLIISFPDGGPDDVAVLEPRTMFLMAGQDLSDTAFIGKLQNDPKVTLAVNGKPTSDYFEVLLNSDRLTKYLYIYENGVVRGEEPMHLNKKVATDAVQVPESDKGQIDMSRINKEKGKSNGCIGSATYNIYVNVDQSYYSYLGSTVAMNAAVTEILNGADVIFKWTELSPCGTLYLNTVGLEHIYETLKADTSHLNTASAISRGNPTTADAYAYLCYQNDLAGTIGIAWVGTTCSTKYYRSAVVERFRTNSQTSETLAHELGHNLGMNHDFDTNSQGHSCPDVGGVMDYNQAVVYQWTQCSLEDFQSYVQYVEGQAGSYCLA